MNVAAVDVPDQGIDAEATLVIVHPEIDGMTTADTEDHQNVVTDMKVAVATKGVIMALVVETEDPDPGIVKIEATKVQEAEETTAATVVNVLNVVEAHSKLVVVMK